MDEAENRTCCMCKQREGILESNIGRWYCQPCANSLPDFNEHEYINSLEEELERLQKNLTEWKAKAERHQSALDQILQITDYSEYEYDVMLQQIGGIADNALKGNDSE